MVEENSLISGNIIKTKYWELPEESLDGWRPYTAYIDYRVFLGPNIDSHQRGLSLDRDLLGDATGPRGSGKSETISYLLAKKMVCGQPVWTNYPISFFLINPNGKLSYHESMPLDFDKFYSFSSEIRGGAVGITEMQYYVESRTSGRLQNRMTTYQIMQLRKTANSFFYDVQDQSWVDKRFGWSNDFTLECTDAAKIRYELGSVSYVPKKFRTPHGYLKDGAVVIWTLKDISGILTGVSYRKSGIEYGPFAFDAWSIWEIYPTHFIIDAYDALHSLKAKDDKSKKREALVSALEEAINQLLVEGTYEVESHDLWNRTEAILGEEVSRNKAGEVLRACGIEKRQGAKGKYFYKIGELLKENNDKD